MRFSPILAIPALLALTLSVSASAGAATKHHHHTAPAVSAEAMAQARHRIRLAAREKKAWQDHLAKLRSLPRAERRAEKRHEKLWQRQHDAKVAALQDAARQTKLAQAREAKRQARQEKLARRHHHAPVLAAQASPVKPKRLARKIAAPRKFSAHQENVARRAALARTRMARQSALKALRQAKFSAIYRAHLVNLQAAHNARVAAGRAHWVALHGDGSGGKNIRFWQTGAAGVPVKVISVDLNDPNVKVSAVMAARGNGTSEPFRQMIQRSHPNVAVTGTFFSLDDLQPVGDIVIDGSLVHFGGMGTALCITPDNKAQMVTCRWGRHHDWSPYDFVVACGPRLLQNSRVVLDPRAERFHDKHMLAPNSRIAVGITRGNTLFFVMTHSPIYLGRLARVMKALGAVEAMNLDAGTSTGFYYNGATLAKPGRKLTNMIVVYGRRDRYERALDQLVPAAYHHSASRPSRPVVQARTASLVRP